jgi:uncharacterized membrane protein
MNLPDIPKAFAEYIDFIVDFTTHPGETLNRMQLEEESLSDKILVHTAIAGLMSFFFFSVISGMSSSQENATSSMLSYFATVDKAVGAEMFPVLLIIMLVIVLFVYHGITWSLSYKDKDVKRVRDELTQINADIALAIKEKKAKDELEEKKKLYMQAYYVCNRNFKDSLNAGLAWFAYFISINAIVMLILMIITQSFQKADYGSAISVAVASGIVLGIFNLRIITFHLPKSFAELHETSVGTERGYLVSTIVFTVAVKAVLEYIK